MDTITHSLLGGLVVRSVFPAHKSEYPLSNRQRLAVGASAAAFPDIDYLGSWVDPMIYLTLWHRGITHSFMLLPVWALFIGILLAFVFRQRTQWRYITLLAGVAVLSHILSDLITVYGTQILAPLSTWRASVGTTFIIDPWFSVIVLGGFLLGLKDRPRLKPALLLAVLVSYVALQATLKYQALTVANHYIHQNGMTNAQPTALPQPFSPFNWKIIIRKDHHYDVAYINLAGTYTIEDDETGFWAEVRRTYQAADNPGWQRFYRYGDDPDAINQIRDLWKNDQLYYFRQFAEIPILYRIDNNAAKTCVWFTDLRYVLPYLTPPFRYGLCRTKPDTDWQLHRLGRSGQSYKL